MNTDAARTLIPTKFLAIGSQIVLSILILYSKSDNLTEYAGTSDFSTQETRLTAYLLSGCAILLMDLLLMFTGITLFRRQSLLFRTAPFLL